ncbi:MAG TPA: hypothetical protein VFJ65_12225 [Solirubrobacterales bacterium]|nr:hypothetical protein [Solirubrobacterales bacterium]
MDLKQDRQWSHLLLGVIKVITETPGGFFADLGWGLSALTVAQDALWVQAECKAGSQGKEDDDAGHHYPKYEGENC